MVSTSTIRIWADAVLLAVFAAAAFISLQSIDSPTYWFPAFISISGVLMAGYNLLADGLRMRAGHSLTAGEITDIGATVADTHDAEAGEERAPGGTESIRRRVLTWSLLLVALPLLGLVIPFFYASLIWLILLLRFYERKTWLFVAVSVAVFGVLLNVLIVLLDIEVPPAILTGLG